MAINWPKPGITHVGEYQSSGHTYVLANDTSARTVNLNYLSSEITVIANADGAVITFEDIDNNTRAITLPKGSHTFKIKCKKFVTNTVSMSVIVACTNIDAKTYHPPTFTALGT